MVAWRGSVGLAGRVERRRRMMMMIYFYILSRVGETKTEGLFSLEKDVRIFTLCGV